MSFSASQRLVSFLLALGCDVGLVLTAAIGPAGGGLKGHDASIGRWCYLAFGACAAFAMPLAFEMAVTERQSPGKKNGRRPKLRDVVTFLFFFTPIPPLAAIAFNASQETALKACAAATLLLISASAAAMITAASTPDRM